MQMQMQIKMTVWNFGAPGDQAFDFFFFFPKEGITLPREALASGRIRHGLDFVSSSHRAREGRGEFSVQVMDHMAALLLHVLSHLCVK